MQDKFLSLNGLRFHFLEWGNASAPPLILLHGFMDHAHRWDTFSRAMCDAFRVLAMDARGHGESDWADDYSRDKMVEDIDAFVRALDLSRVAVVGHSMGARVAYFLAAQNPNAIGKLVIVDMGPELNPAGARRMRTGVLAQNDFASPDELFDAARAANARPTDEDLWNRVRYGLKARADGRWVWRYDPNLRNPTRRPPPRDPAREWTLLKNISCPTLVVRGEESDLLGHATSERMAREIPHAHYVVVKDAGHSVSTDNPEGFLAAVKPFLMDA
ncbi:MAG: alpha/beta hydrolase [Chloroflexi bacterium]|nr:alpha/beta hydrolase [Chloroflexota bacterium]